jgi:hypothetical protein
MSWESHFQPAGSDLGGQIGYSHIVIWVLVYAAPKEPGLVLNCPTARGSQGVYHWAPCPDQRCYLGLSLVIFQMGIAAGGGFVWKRTLQREVLSVCNQPSVFKSFLCFPRSQPRLERNGRRQWQGPLSVSLHPLGQWGTGPQSRWHH